MLCHKPVSIIRLYLIRLSIELMKFNLFDNGWDIVYIYSGPFAPEELMHLAMKLFLFISWWVFIFYFSCWYFSFKKKDIWYDRVQVSRPTMFGIFVNNLGKKKIDQLCQSNKLQRKTLWNCWYIHHINCMFDRWHSVSRDKNKICGNTVLEKVVCFEKIFFWFHFSIL